MSRPSHDPQLQLLMLMIWTMSDTATMTDLRARILSSPTLGARTTSQTAKAA